MLAGERAKASTAYVSALNYLTAGAALLAEDCWERRRELIFALELHRAECEFLTGALAEAEQRLAALSARATDPVERATVACLRVDLYVTLDQSQPRGRRRSRLSSGISASSGRRIRRKRRRAANTSGSGQPSETAPIEALVELPLMSDPASLATLDVLTKFAPPALYTDANLLSLVICRSSQS